MKPPPFPLLLLRRKCTGCRNLESHQFEGYCNRNISSTKVDPHSPFLTPVERNKALGLSLLYLYILSFIFNFNQFEGYCNRNVSSTKVDPDSQFSTPVERNKALCSSHFNLNLIKIKMFGAGPVMAS